MFEAPVAPPNFGQAVAPQANLNWLANLPQAYFQGQQQQRQLAIQNAPAATMNPDGSPNFTALTNKYLQLGDLSDAGSVMQMNLRQRMLSGSGSVDDPMGRGGMAASTATGPLGAPAQSSDSRGVRDNNPGNLVASPWTQGLPGFAGTDGRFARFDTPESGSAALDANLQNYGRKGISTPLAIASTWAPQDEGANNPQAYGSRIASMLGVGLNDRIDLTDPGTRAKVAQAIRVNEGTNAASMAYAPTSSPDLFSRFAADPNSAPVSSRGSANPPGTRVASLGPVAPSASAVANPAMTAGSATSSFKTPAELATVLNPNDPSLAGKIADALNIDPSEAVDTTDVNVRKALLSTVGASRRAIPPGPPPTAAPAGSAGNDDTRRVGSTHPFGPEAVGASANQVGSPASGSWTDPRPIAPGRASGLPLQAAAPGQGMPPAAAPGVAPQPIEAGQSIAPPPLRAPVPAAAQAPQGALPQPAMPSPNDFVPGLNDIYKRPGGGGNAQYLQDLMNKAYQLQMGGLPADVQLKRAEQVQNWINERAKAQTEFAVADERANARARANASYALVETQQPDGTTVYVPKAQVLNGTAGGGPDGSPVVKSQPAYVTQGQSNLLVKLNDGSAAYQERQVAGERLDALAKLQEGYQTGANSSAFNEAAADLRSLGLPVPNSATINPAAMQEFTKNAYANVLSSMKEQGNKQFVSEVQSAINSNPNPDLQPEANAAMISQIKGIQNYRDANFKAYSQWYHSNRGAADDADFQTKWAASNPLGNYVSDARKEAAPLGVAIPPPAQRAIGQRYNVPGKGIFRWMGNGWSAQ